jgi:hypothetical protein
MDPEADVTPVVVAVEAEVLEPPGIRRQLRDWQFFGQRYVHEMLFVEEGRQSS